MLKNALLVVLSLVVALSLIELLLVLQPGLQAENPPEDYVFCEGPPRRLRSDVVLGATETPNSAYFERKTEADGWAVHIYNESGFRDVFDTGSKHVIVLGDSFTRGTLVSNDETFAYLLDLWHPDLAFDNFGTGGYGTGDAYRLYRSVARSIDHDLVVLGYFVGNDLLENLRYDPARADADRRPPAAAEMQSGVTEHRSALLKLHVLLRTYSRAYSLVYMTLKKALYGAHPSLNMSAPARAHALDVTRMILEELIAETSSNGADLLIVILPYWNEMVDPDASRFADLQRALIGELAGRHDHVHALDLLDVIRGAGPENAFGEVDKHFNRYGQYLTAQAIHEWMINGSWRGRPLAVGQVPPFERDRPPVVPECGALERYRQSFERQADVARGNRSDGSAMRP